MIILLIILGMALVTYLPKMIPALFLDNIKVNPAVEKFLLFIPCTAMTSLIFPGVLKVDQNCYWIGLLGCVVAIVLSWQRLPLTMVILGAVLADVILYWLM